MTDPVFYGELPAHVQPGATVALSAAEAKHAEVKRLRAGERFVLADGNGRAATCAWLGTATDGAHAEILAELPVRTPNPRVTVVQAIPKSERSELAVDLMVQAGADHIIPWGAQRCIAKWDKKADKAKTKWEQAALAAAKQSRRLTIPTIDSYLTNLADLPNRLRNTPTVHAANTSAQSAGATEPTPEHPPLILALHENATTSITTIDYSTTNHIVLVVGPEGGISPEELKQLQHLGAQPVLLGPEVLRTASAAMVGLAAIGALTPRWQQPPHTT